jgi:HK97 gp10 family phage protein
MRGRVRFEGLRELDRNLGQLTKSAARGALRRVGIKALRPMADTAKALAPRDQGDLIESITVGTKVSGADAGKQAFASVMASGGSRTDAGAALRAARAGNATMTVYMGPGRHPQAITQEFGTFNQPPQPYMRPAWDQHKGPLLDDLKVQLFDEITRSIIRQQRRLARG